MRHVTILVKTYKTVKNKKIINTINNKVLSHIIIFGRLYKLLSAGTHTC